MKLEFNMIGRYFILFILITHIAFAPSVQPTGYAVFDPQPGTEFEFKFKFEDNTGSGLRFSKGYDTVAQPGDSGYDEEMEFFKSLVIPDEIEGDEWSSLQSTVVFRGVWPEFRTPGRREIMVGAGQRPTDHGGGMGARAGITGSIKIVVPYDGPYAEINFLTENVQPGEPVPLNYTLVSVGTEPLNELLLTVTVRNGDEILNTFVEEVKMPADEFSSFIDLGVYDPGYYDIELGVSTNTQEIVRTGKFLVADNTLRYDCPDLFVRPQIEQVSVRITSGYLDEVSSDVSIEVGGKTLASESDNLLPLQQTAVRLFADFTMDLGEYEYTVVADGNNLCSGTVHVKSPERASIPTSVYVVGGLFVLVTLALLVWYYFNRDDEEETEF